MKPVEISSDHHVLRYCKARLIERDDAKGIREMWPEALALRPAETYLSVSYYEYFSGSHDERVKASIAALKQRHANIKGADAMVMMNVGEIRESGKVQRAKIRVLHERKVGKEDYAAIRGIPPKYDAELSALLCRTAVRDIIFLSECA
jgi:hypothetical protein